MVQVLLMEKYTFVGGSKLESDSIEQNAGKYA